MSNSKKQDIKLSKATATSDGSTTTNNHVSGFSEQQHLANNPEHPSKNGTTKRCSSSRQSYRFRPWMSVVPLIRDLRRRVPNVSLNRVLNESFLLWLGGKNEDELRLKSRLAGLLQEEHELMQTNRVILRSGAFLDSYVAKLVEGNEGLSVKLGRQPLGALANKKEVSIVLRLLARREAIVNEILDIQNLLLPGSEYVLKADRESFPDYVKKTKGGEKQNGADT
jgi:hypothetical protein